MPKKLIAQGAEAKLFLEKNKILKNRFPKSYRIREIDDKLRGFRTRREAKILQKLEAINFPAPKLIKNDEKENLIIEKINGSLIKDILETSINRKAIFDRDQKSMIFDKSDYKKLCSGIGKKIAILHNNLIIHGDLTTSNMILSNASELRSARWRVRLSRASQVTRTRSQLTETYFIDFGLSFFSDKAEDKAVDLHLLKEALESKHYKIWEVCFSCAIDAYKKEANGASATLKRLGVVEKRGRYRAKKGS